MMMSTATVRRMWMRNFDRVAVLTFIAIIVVAAIFNRNKTKNYIPLHVLRYD